MKPQISIGVDFGTNSVRAHLVDVANGQVVGGATADYRRGDAGVLLDPADPNVARQDPADYIDGFITAVASAVKDAGAAGVGAADFVGLGVDATSSTPLPVNGEGVPLAMLQEFKGDLAAQSWLWKDHTSFAEADEITAQGAIADHPYLSKCGESYSSEWYWAKIAHCMRTAPQVARAAASWVELCDFIPAYITGNTRPEAMPRSICAAGHKAMYHEDWSGLPSVDFLESIEPGLSRFRYTAKALASDNLAGRLTAEVADKVGLPAGLPVSVGAVDAHAGAVGAGCGEGVLVTILGTSSCHCLVVPQSRQLDVLPGISGIVPDSIIPGMYGIEAGQCAVGDIFNWFVSQVCMADDPGAMHQKLTTAAEKLRPGESGLVALDWNNGNRNILGDPLLSGLLVGQTLQTTAAEMYRALIEATAFGALTIINRLEEYGVEIQKIVACGGIAEKNPLVMQIYTDVCNRPMVVSDSNQACALGAAIYGAVAGGSYATVQEAQAKMVPRGGRTYVPNAENAAVYSRLYSVYKKLHDAFGTDEGSIITESVMKDLIQIRNQVRGSGANI
jgi:L-ribulokinase